MIRTRFAPSPTGYLHVGGLRTALYAYLIAKKNGGDFLLRLEDTDRERFVSDSAEKMLVSLYWAGIEPGEGLVIGEDGTVAQKGNKGPYIQSERLEMYQKYAKQLLDNGQAYYCFCTSERMEQLRELQQKNKFPSGYDGLCAKIEPAEAVKRAQGGEKHVVRLKMLKTGEITFQDAVRGEVTFKNALVDDQVLMKSDGFPTYHLAVVVDDHFMEITHVIRGEEWVSSTPKHIQLYKYFGWEIPEFAHLPLLLNSDKSKLSKRQGDVAVSDYAAKGYLPEALINFVAFLGWNPGTDKEIYSLDELVKDFSLEKVSKAGAVFNIEKLNWFNREYIKKMSLAEFAGRAVPFLAESSLISPEKFGDKKVFVPWLEKVLALEKDRITTLAEIPEAVKFVFELPDYLKNLLVWRKGTMEEARRVLPEIKELLNTFSVQDWNKVFLEQKIGEWIKTKGYATGSVLWPLRVSLSGQQNSPGPYEIAEVLGKEEALERLQKAIEKIA